VGTGDRTVIGRIARLTGSIVEESMSAVRMFQLCLHASWGGISALGMTCLFIVICQLPAFVACACMRCELPCL
jgi:hypothetical protein